MKTIEEMQAITLFRAKRLEPTYINKVGFDVKELRSIIDNPNSRKFYDYLPWLCLTYADDFRKIVSKLPEANQGITILKYGLIAITWSLEKYAKFIRVT